MRRMRIVPAQVPRKAKVLALSLPSDAQERALMLIHALLALMAPLLIFAIVGCDQNRDGIPVDYGVETSAGSITEALSNAIDGIEPATVSTGAEVRFETSQNVGGGQYYNLASDTIQRVDSKDTSRSTEYTVLKIIETKYAYQQGEQTKVTVTEREVPVLNPQPPATPTPVPSATPKPAPSPVPSPTPTPEPGTRVTFHNLKIRFARVPAPPAVQKRPGCLGIPDCQIETRYISFDQVIWESAQGDRINFEFTISPQLPPTAGYNMSLLFPFLPGLYRSCVTLKVPIGDNNKSLLTECQRVFDFKYTATPAPTPAAETLSPVNASKVPPIVSTDRAQKILNDLRALHLKSLQDRRRTP